MFLTLKDILWFSLILTKDGRFRNNGRWWLNRERIMPMEEGAVKFVQEGGRGNGAVLRKFCGEGYMGKIIKRLHCAREIVCW